MSAAETQIVGYRHRTKNRHIFILFFF